MTHGEPVELPIERPPPSVSEFVSPAKDPDSPLSSTAELWTAFNRDLPKAAKASQ